MKKKIASYLSYSLAVLTLLTGCSNGEENEPAIPATPKVEIHLGGSVPAPVQHRSAISSGQYLTAMLVGREGTTQAEATQAWTASGSFYADPTTGQEISIAPKQYYKDEEGTHTYILGIYPSGTLQGNKVILTRTDGEQDVMLSGWTDAGTKKDNTEPDTPSDPAWTRPSYNLAFAHHTAQIYFEAKAAANGDGNFFSDPTYVESITLRNVQVPRAINLTTTEVEFSDPDELGIPGVPSVGLGEKPVTCGRPVMVNASAQLVVDIVLNMGGSSLVFPGVVLKDENRPDVNLVTSIGQRHKVTLIFTVPEEDPEGAVRVNATATVEDWEEGNSGSVIL